jgi:hypothetical protein
LALYLGSRAAGYIAILAATWLEPSLRVKQAYTAWDGGWYLLIAKHWYPGTVANAKGVGNQWAFFPGFPLVVRVTKYATHLSYADAAILVAWIFGGLAAVAIGMLVRDVLGNGTALKTVAVVMFYPAAFVLNFAYPEGMFLAAAATCLLFIYRERWILAAVLANVACLTKEPGVVLAIAIAAEALRPGRTARSRLLILGSAAASCLAFVGWCLYGLSRTGHLLAFVDAENDWGGRGFVWFETPFKSVWHLLTTRAAWHMTGPPWTNGAPTVAAATGLVVAAVGFVFLILLHRRSGVSPAWWAYSIGATLVAFSPFWPMGVLRYTMCLLPLFAAFAHLARPRLLDFTIGAFALFQGALAVVVLVSLVRGPAAAWP